MAGEATASGLRFFLDRGLGSVVVPRALRAAGWTLETMDERYGADQSQNIQDTQWIEEVSRPAFSGLANLRLSYAVAFISRNSSMASCGVRYPSAEWRRFRL